MRQLTIFGSVLDESHANRLKLAQRFLCDFKANKIQSRNGKHKGNDKATVDDLIGHLDEEFHEFLAAVESGDREHALEELADTSSLVDILAMMILFEDEYGT